MSVVYAEELFDGTGGSADKDGRGKYTRRWEVRTDNPADDITVAVGAAEIPARGSPYPTDPFSLAKSVRADRGDSPTLWYVTVEYDSTFDWPTGVQPSGAEPSPESGATGGTGSAPDPGQQAENPLDRPPQWRCTYQTTQEVAEYDFAGEPILNAAGLPFDPPVMRDVSFPTITLTRNVASVSFSDIQLLQDAVNDAAWCGFPARSVRCTGIEFGPVYENGLAYWSITYQFAVKYPNWDFKILNAGYTEKVAGAWKAITDADGKEPSEPVPLAADGTKLDPSGTPNFLTFQVYPERNFKTLF